MNQQILLSQIFTLSANGTTVPANVSARDFQNIGLWVVGGDTADFKIRVKGSLQQNPPDFTAVSSPTNEWSYIELKNDLTNSFINGQSGYTFSSDGTVAFELNTSVLTWVALEMFDRNGGTATAQFIFKNNI